MPKRRLLMAAAAARNGRKHKRIIPTGEWCQLCRNIRDIKIKEKRYAQCEVKEKGKGLKMLKEDLRRRPDVKEAWMAMHDEAVHLRSGGRSRISKYNRAVTKSQEVIQDLVAPSKQFWEEPEYRKEFGSPRKNKAKLVSRYILTESGKRKKVKGIYVNTGRRGVHEVVNRTRDSVKDQEDRHDGHAPHRSAKVSHDPPQGAKRPSPISGTCIKHLVLAPAGNLYCTISLVV